MANGDSYSPTTWDTGDWTTPSVAIGSGVVQGNNAITTGGGGDALDVSGSLAGLTDQNLVDAGMVPAGGGTLGGNLANWVTQNPMNALGVLAGGGMLASEAFGTSPQQQTLNLLQQNQTGAQTMATALQAPLFGGALPPGAQTALQTAENQQIASTRSAYAKAGMAGSTGEADAVNAVKANIEAQQFGIAMNMFNQAAQYAKLSSADLATIFNEQRAMDQDFSNALSRFVSALAGGGGGTPQSGGSGGSGGTSSTAPTLGSAISDSSNSIMSFFGLS